MELKRGKLKLNGDIASSYKTIATLLCTDGMVYVISDEVLQVCASEIDKMSSADAAVRARELFGCARSARVSKKGVVYIKDCKEAVELLKDGFSMMVLDRGNILLAPTGVDALRGRFFRDKIIEALPRPDINY